MQAIGYFVSLPFIYLVALLPFPVFYIFSDVVFFILYYLIGYRKKIVYRNLKKSFPEKNDKEIKSIEKKFYKYLCDLILETFKNLVISRKSVLKRCIMDIDSFNLLEKYYADRKKIIIVMGHYGNWEWAGNTFSLICKHQLYVIYHPVKNKYFNTLLYKMRTRFGTKLIAMKDTFKEMIRNRAEISATAFIADQTPPPDNAYWTTFLNQETPVFWGTELIAKKLNQPVIYVTVKRTGRGYYKIFAEELVTEPAKTETGKISELHTRKLEKDIIECPEIWLWSHKRWKYSKPN